MNLNRDRKGGAIVEAVYQAAQAHPDKTAFTFHNAIQIEPATCHMTYQELWEKATVISDRLDTVRKGDLALLVMPLGPKLLAHHLAILISGATASIYTHPSPKIGPEIYNRNLAHALGQVRPDHLLLSDDTIVNLHRTLAEQGMDYLSALELDQLESPRGLPAPKMDIAPDSPAIVQHSSGSTGLQKGVCLSHEKVTSHCRAYGRNFGFSPEYDAVCSWLPLYHDMGLFTSWLLPLIHGATTHFLDPFDWVQHPLSILRLANEKKGTLMWQPNFAYRLLTTRVSDYEMETLDLAHVRGFVNCSEPVIPSTMAAFHSRFRQCGVVPTQLWNCYAMAENSFAVTQASGEDAMAAMVEADLIHFSKGKVIPGKEGQSKSIASCGKPVEGCNVKIVDDDGNPKDDGSVGEVAIKSPYLFQNYLNNKEATSLAFDKQGWYLTGDLGFLLKGHLYITGRKKDLLIVGGRNFYPHDIEDICNRVHDVVPGRAVALGMDDDALGTQRVVVIAESKSRDEQEHRKISKTIRQLVFEEMDCPVSEVLVVPHMWLLKTSSGKIARQPNLEKFTSHKSSVASFSPPVGKQKLATVAPASSIVVALWAFLFALVIYLYMGFVALSQNKSWIIYLEF